MLRGMVNAGQHFVAQIAPDLFFHLVPRGADGIINGWEINVTPSASYREGDDLSGAVTPPFRFDNPRYLDTSYGKAAKTWAAGGVAGGSFAMNEADGKRARALLARILWPQSDDDFQQALAESSGIRTGTVKLRVVSSRTSPASPAHKLGTIDYLDFDVTACVPK